MILIRLILTIGILTVFAVLTRFCLLGYEVYYPIVYKTFEEDTAQIYAKLRSIESISKGCIQDSNNEEFGVCAGAGTCYSDWTRQEAAAVPFAQLHITIVAATEQSPLTNYQMHVMERYRNYLSKSFGQLRSLGIDVRIRFSAQYYTGLNKHYQYHQSVGDEEQVCPYILHDNLLNEELFGDVVGYAANCTAGNNCKAVTLMWYLPDLAGSHDHNGTESNKDSVLTTHAMRIVHNVSEILAERSAYGSSSGGSTASGFILPYQRCFTVLDLHSKDKYDAVDADMIYSALQLSIQCLRDAVGVPSAIHTPPQDSNSVSGITNELNEALSIGSVEWARFMWNRIESMHSITLQKLRVLIQLYKYRDNWWRLFAMNGRQRSAFRQIMRQLHEMNAMVTELSQTNSAVPVIDLATPHAAKCALFLRQFEDRSGPGSVGGRTSIVRLERVLRSTFELVLQLEYEPGGHVRESTSVEQYFAIFGPYWLPLMVPAYRALRSAFV